MTVKDDNSNNQADSKQPLSLFICVVTEWKFGNYMGNMHRNREDRIEKGFDRIWSL